MTTATDVDLSEAIDLDKPLVCEVTFVAPNGKRFPCDREATHVGTGHDVYKGHKDNTVPLCAKCAAHILAWYDDCQLCGVPMIKNVRPL